MPAVTLQVEVAVVVHTTAAVAVVRAVAGVEIFKTRVVLAAD